MEQQRKSAFGKNNFDRMEAAGLVAGDDTTASIKAKAQARIVDLHALAAKVGRVEAALADLYVLPKPAQLKKLTQVLTAVKKLYETPLPVGAKKYIGNCLNELVSLREGVFASNSQMDRKTLTLIAASQAKADINVMIISAETRMDRINAESSQEGDLDDFLKKTQGVINKYASESTKLTPLNGKPYMIARVPVVPTGSAVASNKPTMISVDRLTHLGFSVDSLGGYAVLHNQLVIGINPKFLFSDSTEGKHAGGVKSENVVEATRKKADLLRLAIEKKQKIKLQFVADKAYSYGSGTWFWLMSNKELDAFARAFPGSHVNVTRWGFAFNDPTKKDKASDPETSVEVLTQLAKSSNIDVRREVAANPNTPEEILTILFTDKDATVRTAVRDNRQARRGA